MSKLDNINLEDLEELLGEEEKHNIDWTSIFRRLYAKRKLFLISAVLTIVIVFPLVLTIPKYYQVEVKLAPEFASTSSSSGLSSIMKVMGMRSSSSGADDAILPNLYPDLMNSNAFLISLFDVPVRSMDGDIKTTYYDYLLNYQKSSVMSKVMGFIFSLLPKDDDSEESNNSIVSNGHTQVYVDAGKLSKKQTAIAKAIAQSVVCDVDDKTGVITINVTDQDPIICTTIADSACNRLQEFITEYRTKKARIEMQNAQKQYNQAKLAYESAKHNVQSFSDSNWDLVDEDLLTEKQALQNNMQMCFSNMSAFNQQLLAARAKYESLRPVYTVLDGATVPVKSAGPHRFRTILLFLFLVLAAEVVWILFVTDFKKKMKDALKDPEAKKE